MSARKTVHVSMCYLQRFINVTVTYVDENLAMVLRNRLNITIDYYS